MKSYHSAISVCSYKRNVYALFEITDEGERMLFIGKSEDGTTFTPLHEKPLYIGTAINKENLSKLHHLHLSVDENGYYLTYVKIPRTKPETIVAFSRDGRKFTPEKTLDLATSGYLLPDFQSKAKESLMYLGDKYITSATKKGRGLWNESGAIVLAPRDGFFDSSPIKLLGCATRENGILLSYESSHLEGDKYFERIGLALLSKNNPHHVLWRSEVPLFDKVYEGPNMKHQHPRIIGMAVLNDSIFIYHKHLEGLTMIRLPCTIHVRSKDRAKHNSILNRHDQNPILTPDPGNNWEREAVFNPAVLHDGESTHLLYRAIGHDGVSRIGYAKSPDGVKIDFRHNEPVFEPSRGYGLPKKGEKFKGPKKYNPAYYTSGGGWGGCEDPRIVEIEGRIYMTYVAFGGWDSIRMAVTSISKEDFLNNEWNWSKPRYMSPPRQMNKNWVIFPEKINGKFAILHSITPEILIDYVDDLDTMKPLKSRAPAGGRDGYWDHKVRGAGPPPIRTELGWLVLYHATGKHDGHRYKLGAMILDLNDPTKVLYRSSNFILAPDMDYENEGKPGVVYASGAVIINDTLHVYYGGGDRVVCVATIPLETLLQKLKNHEEIKLEPTEAVLV